MRVLLLVTGRAEELGLAVCLKHAFPDHEFTTWFGDGFTSSWPIPRNARAPTNLDKLVQRLAAEVACHDHVVLVEDADAAYWKDDMVGLVGAVRAAVRLHLEKTLNDRMRTRTGDLLKARASFHLAVPMLEAWFFADTGALQAAGVPAGTAQLAKAGDIEDFQTDDPAYESADGAECAAWHAKGDPANQRPQWLRSLPRSRHPKAYLSWLLRAANELNCSAYRETRQGVDALAALNLRAAVAAPGQCRFLRALVDDLADALGAVRPEGDCGQLTARANPDRLDPVLRNI
ncbi:MAG: hypothetical protein HY904_16295 [Deltaproteobacteria bacterium]|nr:hypothetical protein [Deltaproteobacteria bacterium]